MTDKVIKWNRIMDDYYEGVYGEDHLTFAQILEKAGEPNLIKEMNFEELTELINSLSSGPMKACIAHMRDKNEYDEIIQQKSQKSSEHLLLLEEHSLEVWKSDGNVCIAYADNLLSKDPGQYCFKKIYGRGRTFEEACDDYLRKIEGKTLKFGNKRNRRSEIFILPAKKF